MMQHTRLSRAGPVDGRYAIIEHVVAKWTLVARKGYLRPKLVVIRIAQLGASTSLNTAGMT
jgi:hypothetical protein